MEVEELTYTERLHVVLNRRDGPRKYLLPDGLFLLDMHFAGGYVEVLFVE